jgi:mannose-6-phosphate isomerase-like protein (cupin superfamily)
MNDSQNEDSNPPALLRILAGQDRFGEHRGLGISSIAFKIIPQDSSGILILENTFQAKGGPARHLHYEQDEWFYAVEGEFVVEIGEERIQLKPGDSLLARVMYPMYGLMLGTQRAEC